MVHLCTLVLATIALTASSTFSIPVAVGTLEARNNQEVDAVKNAGHRVKAAIESRRGQGVVKTVQKVAAFVAPALPLAKAAAMLVAREPTFGVPVTVGTLEARDNKVVGAVKNTASRVKAGIQSPRGQGVIKTVQNVAAVGERVLPFLQNSKIAATAEKALPLAETAAGMLVVREPTLATPTVGTLETRNNKVVDEVKNAGSRVEAGIQSPKGQVAKTARKVVNVGEKVAPFVTPAFPLVQAAARLVLREAELLVEG